MIAHRAKRVVRDLKQRAVSIYIVGLLLCVVKHAVSRVVKPGLINAVLNYSTASSPTFTMP